MADQTDNAPAEEAEVDERDRRPRPEAAGAAPAAAAGASFLHIYKSGQGYWTRLGTVLGVLLVVALLARFAYVTGWTYLGLSKAWSGGLVGGIVIAVAILLWRYLNKPTVVDFLIATESEMKKVNWTSRKDLIGSTKVVIFFMFLIAIVLFLIDIAFGWAFHMIGVLKYGPFQ